jgi:hypothetical protein
MILQQEIKDEEATATWRQAGEKWKIVSLRIVVTMLK